MILSGRHWRALQAESQELCLLVKVPVEAMKFSARPATTFEFPPR